MHAYNLYGAMPRQTVGVNNHCQVLDSDSYGETDIKEGSTIKKNSIFTEMMEIMALDIIIQ